MSWASISTEAEKHKKKNCVSLPQAKRVRKNQNSIRVPGTRGRDQPVSDRLNPTKLIQIQPIPWSLGQIWPNHVPDVVRPILAPESRSRGIRWGDRRHFSSRICSDGSRGPKIRENKNCVSSPGDCLRAPLL